MMIVAILGLALLQQTPPQSVDADTKAWWATTTVLSSDAMEGRDTGSPGYQRAADVVAKRFAAAGLKPLGDNGTWFQTVAMEETRVTQASIEVGGRKLGYLSDIMVSVASAKDIDAPIVYRGYCGANDLGDVSGKLVICHATRRVGLPNDGDRMMALSKAGAAGIIAIADPGFTIEPPRWPFAYSRSVTLAGANPPAARLASLTLNAASLGKVIEGTGQDAAALIDAGSTGRPLPSFDLTARLHATFTTAHRAISSPNVVGILPGTDPAKSNEAIVLTAHLDGYGYGESVKGDTLYNGTLDDAAYVALMIQLAERRAGKGFRRPVIFVALTGEEKGLLGSNWFVAHLPVQKSQLAGNINLDQLRPLFPLELLTVHALDDTSLGDDARAVATSLGIAVQNDPEPERRLLQRTDHWTFLRAGIPAVNFVFGFRPGTESERIYRQWYREGYHTPQDDLNQHIDWKAAGDFNRFYYGLVERVASQETVPTWKPDSKLRPAMQ
ncbi:MAG: M28 family peptidase [Gemmatimonadaceae bacterium]